MASCIVVPDPIFRMALFCKISSWNHISHYQTVLNPCNLKCWTLTSLHYTDVLSWMAISNLKKNENAFSVPFERHTLLKSLDIILHASFRWHHQCHCDKLAHVIVMITWIWNADTGKKDHFWTKLYRVTSIANNVANPLIFYMSIVHDMLPWYSQAHLIENIWFLP